MRGNQFAIGAVEHIHEAIFVGLDHHFAELSVDPKIRKQLLVVAVNVINIVGRVLKITSHLACFRPNREHAGSEEAVHSLARARIIGFRVAGAPVNEIEVGIIRTGAPRRASAVFPGIAIFRPRFGTGFAGRRDGVSAPQFLSCIWIPAIEESAGGGFSAGLSGDQDAVGNDRPTGGVVALFPVGEALVPEFFAGLHVESEEVIIDGHAKDFAVINRGRAAIERDMLDAGFEFHGRAPDLAAGLHVNGKGPLAVDDVHDAVIDRRLREFAEFIHGAGVPDGDQAFDIGFIDLIERAIALAVVAHALGEDVFRVLAVLIELFGRLTYCRRDPQANQVRADEKFLHRLPPTCR